MIENPRSESRAPPRFAGLKRSAVAIVAVVLDVILGIGAFGGVLKVEMGSARARWRSAPGAAPILTWTFVLEKRSGGSTRLVVRARGGRGYAFYGLPPRIGVPFVLMAQRIENHDMPTEAA